MSAPSDKEVDQKAYIVMYPRKTWQLLNRRFDDHVGVDDKQVAKTHYCKRLGS